MSITSLLRRCSGNDNAANAFNALGLPGDSHVVELDRFTDSTTTFSIPRFLNRTMGATITSVPDTQFNHVIRPRGRSDPGTAMPLTMALIFLSFVSIADKCVLSLLVNNANCWGESVAGLRLMQSLTYLSNLRGSSWQW